MRTRHALPLLFAAALAGCASLGLGNAFPSAGPVDSALLEGDLAADFRDYRSVRTQLVRSKGMRAAGARVTAVLVSPARAQVEYLMEARRIREPEEAIRAELGRLGKARKPDELCLDAYLRHSRRDLASPEKWVFKVQIDGGPWTRMSVRKAQEVKAAGRESWTSQAEWCAALPRWTEAREIRADVFPPVLRVPGEARLAWSLRRPPAAEAAGKGGS